MAQQCSTLKGFIDPRCGAHMLRMAPDGISHLIVAPLIAPAYAANFALISSFLEKCQQLFAKKISSSHFAKESTNETHFSPADSVARDALDTPEEKARASSKHSYFNGFLSKSRQKILSVQGVDYSCE